VIKLSRGHICKHLVISVGLLFCFLLLQTTLTQNFCNDLHRGKKGKKMVENAKIASLFISSSISLWSKCSSFGKICSYNPFVQSCTMASFGAFQCSS